MAASRFGFEVPFNRDRAGDRLHTHIRAHHAAIPEKVSMQINRLAGRERSELFESEMTQVFGDGSAAAGSWEAEDDAADGSWDADGGSWEAHGDAQRSWEADGAAAAGSWDTDGAAGTIGNDI